MRLAKQDARRADLLRYKNNPEALQERRAEEALKHQNYMKSRIDKHLEVLLQRGYPEVVNKFIKEIVMNYKGNIGVSFINKIVVLADAFRTPSARDNITPNTLKETGTPLKEGEDYEAL
jgi:hypothetical protein